MHLLWKGAEEQAETIILIYMWSSIGMSSFPTPINVEHHDAQSIIGPAIETMELYKLISLTL